MNFGTLRVLNDDIISGGWGFGTHPHQNMEIITIPFSGELEHTDSLGNSGIISAWEVQSMSAGTWVLHSEKNASLTQEVSLFQIWIQTREDNIEPQYSQKQFDESERKNTWQLLAGPDKNGKNVLINQDAYISRVTLEKWKTLSYQKYISENIIYVMNISGEFSLWENILEKRDALGIVEQDSVEIFAKEQSDILVIEIPQK